MVEKKYLKQNNIDVEHGIELLGDMKMYNETMNIFYDGLEERINKIEKCKQEKDIEYVASNYKILMEEIVKVLIVVKKYLGK